MNHQIELNCAMFDPLFHSIAFPCFFALIAGFVDAIAGGGGLIQLPALLIWMPNAPIAVALGTNKCSSVAGTAAAAWRYSRAIENSWRTILPSTVLAFLGALAGARAVSFLSANFLRPMVLVLLIIVTVWTFCRHDFGESAKRSHPFIENHTRLLSALMGIIIGFYDGFFGPGTGSFLTFLLIGVFGMPFLKATAGAKIINLSTNLGALTLFAFQGNINFGVAIPMAMCNVIGAQFGTQLAIKRGSAFVRVIFLCVVSALTAKLAWDF